MPSDTNKSKGRNGVSTFQLLRLYLQVIHLKPYINIVILQIFFHKRSSTVCGVYFSEHCGWKTKGSKSVELLVLRDYHLGVSKNRGGYPPKWIENNGKPYEQMDDLGGKPPLFLETPIWCMSEPFFPQRPAGCL